MASDTFCFTKPKRKVRAHGLNNCLRRCVNQPVRLAGLEVLFWPPRRSAGVLDVIVRGFLRLTHFRAGLPTAAAAARRRRPSRAARRRRRRRCRTRSSRRRRAATPTSSSSSRAVSCAERHHPVYGGRSLPCFPGGTVAFGSRSAPCFPPCIYTTLSSTGEHARAERLDVLARPPDGLEHLRAFNRRAARLEREHRGVVARRVQDHVHGAPAAVDRNR